jgi:hypothetical protein
MKASIRDILKCTNLFKFFYRRNFVSPNAGNLVRRRRSMLLAVALAYFFRLPEEHEGRKVRQEFLKLMPKDFLEIVDDEIRIFFGHLEIPHGIASTRALLENIFSIVVCVSTGIPLIIVGPPGKEKRAGEQGRHGVGRQGGMEAGRQGGQEEGPTDFFFQAAPRPSASNSFVTT